MQWELIHDSTDAVSAARGGGGEESEERGGEEREGEVGGKWGHGVTRNDRDEEGDGEDERWVVGRVDANDMLQRIEANCNTLQHNAKCDATEMMQQVPDDVMQQESAVMQTTLVRVYMYIYEYIFTYVYIFTYICIHKFVFI